MSAVIRAEEANYTKMSNIHLRDEKLSLKAKGLLSLMYSLPVDRWQFSVRGLAAICKDGVDSVREGIRELERSGYVTRIRERKKNGQMGEAFYTIYEKPMAAADKPETAAVSAITHKAEKKAASVPVQSIPVIPSLPAMENPMLDFPTQVFPAAAAPSQVQPAQLNTYGSMTQKEKLRLNPVMSYPYPSFVRPSIPAYSAMMRSTGIEGLQRRMTMPELEREVREQIEYDILRDQISKDDLDNIVSLMAEVFAAKCQYFTISRKQYPLEFVQQRFRELNSSHIQYVFDCLEASRSSIRNIKQYLLTSLFNAPSTFSSYYSAQVRHDYDFRRCVS
ncbi:MAG: helix-turn-helix domain-containing protein [Clostridia bacterium]|nr:helix-turn-helix domain-containing protein [Clostridia bacterium]